MFTCGTPYSVPASLNPNPTQIEYGLTTQRFCLGSKIDCPRNRNVYRTRIEPYQHRQQHDQRLPSQVRILTKMAMPAGQPPVKGRLAKLLRHRNDSSGIEKRSGCIIRFARINRCRGHTSFHPSWVDGEIGRAA